jgi:hypothetical protein
MRPLHIYLFVYFLLVIGAGLALWQAGVLARVSPLSLLLAGGVVVGLGVFLALTAAPRRIRT